MSAASTLQITEKLPPELLEKILTYAPVPDIIRLEQVGKQSDHIQRSQLNFSHPLLWQANRAFRDFIQGSPYVKHRINLFAVGLKDNPFANLTLDDRKKAYERRPKWETFKPTERLQQAAGNPTTWNRVNMLGVYAFIADPRKFIEFITLESVSRGIPRKEWRLPLPHFALREFAIDPHADVLVIIVQKNIGYLSDPGTSDLEFTSH